MNIWGHYEKVPIQGSKRKANIYVPSLLNSVCLPFIFFAIPVATILSSSDKGESLLESPLSFLLGLLFWLFWYAFGLLGVWAGVRERKDVKRMRNGELVLRTGELFILSRGGRDKYGVYSYYRFALRNCQGKNNGDVEIYDMPKKLYQKFYEHRSCRKDRAHSKGRVNSIREADERFRNLQPWVCLVGIAVLPPEKGEEFRMIDLSKKLKTILWNNKFGISHNWKFPLFNGTVADIFSIRGSSDLCIINTGGLFEG